MTTVVNRIIEDLNTIKSAAEYQEDGNTVALINKMLRDLSSLHPNFTTIEIAVPVKKTKAELPKSDTKAIT